MDTNHSNDVTLDVFCFDLTVVVVVVVYFFFTCHSLQTPCGIPCDGMQTAPLHAVRSCHYQLYRYLGEDWYWMNTKVNICIGSILA